MSSMRFAGLAGLLLLWPLPAVAQQAPQQQVVPQQPQPSSQWEQLPRMQLERQFAGPLRDTIIQRWRDPADGMVCYIYLPITAQHTPPGPTGFVQYGSNTIGSISCVPQAAPPPPPRAQTPSQPRPPARAVNPPPAAPGPPPQQR